MSQSLAEFLGIALARPDETEHIALVDVSALSVQDFCLGVLHSREYRESIKMRIELGILPPAIEQLFYYYAFGKPVDRHEHGGVDGEPLVVKVVRVIVDARQHEDDDQLIEQRYKQVH